MTKYSELIISIERYIAQKSLSRARFAAEVGLSLSSINNLLGGAKAPSPRMLTKIDAKTGIITRDKRAAFDFEVGRPERHLTAHLEGDYQVIRPSYREEGNLSGYVISISFNETLGGLVFEEKNNDMSPQNKGCVSIPFSNNTMHLLSCQQGNFRLITLSNAYEPGIFYGGILTLASKKMIERAPAAVIMVLKKLESSDEPHFGILRPADGKFSEFQALIDFGRTEGFFRVLG